MSEYNQYVTAVNKIFDYIAKLKAGWNSQDNLNYIESLEEYKQVVIGNADVFKTPAVQHNETTESTESTPEQPQKLDAPEQLEQDIPAEQPQPAPSQLEETVQSSDVAVTPEQLSQNMEALGND